MLNDSKFLRQYSAGVVMEVEVEEDEEGGRGMTADAEEVLKMRLVIVPITIPAASAPPIEEARRRGPVYVIGRLGNIPG